TPKDPIAHPIEQVRGNLPFAITWMCRTQFVSRHGRIFLTYGPSPQARWGRILVGGGPAADPVHSRTSYSPPCFRNHASARQLVRCRPRWLRVNSSGRRGSSAYLSPLRRPLSSA